jgi:hypothetical protein
MLINHEDNPEAARVGLFKRGLKILTNESRYLDKPNTVSVSLGKLFIFRSDFLLLRDSNPELHVFTIDSIYGSSSPRLRCLIFVRISYSPSSSHRELSRWLPCEESEGSPSAEQPPEHHVLRSGHQLSESIFSALETG